MTDERPAAGEAPVQPRGDDASARARDDAYARAYLRPEGEDDDGYDPYSDRPPAPEPLWERDPWR